MDLSCQIAVHTWSPLLTNDYQSRGANLIQGLTGYIKVQLTEHLCS